MSRSFTDKAEARIVKVPTNDKTYLLELRDPVNFPKSKSGGNEVAEITVTLLPDYYPIGVNGTVRWQQQKMSVKPPVPVHKATVTITDVLKGEKTGFIRYILELRDPDTFPGNTRDGYETVEMRVAVSTKSSPMEVEVTANWQEPKEDEFLEFNALASDYAERYGSIRMGLLLASGDISDDDIWLAASRMGMGADERREWIENLTPKEFERLKILEPVRDSSSKP